jgi:triacylglycerol esterase/lipase EstA (alpha/beta hydrolase family)
VLDSLAPARRLLVLAVAGLLAVALVAVVVAVVATREPAVEPVDQDTLGPVLLVPGYGGSTASLEVLAEALEESGREARVVPLGGGGTGDLREQAEMLDGAVADAMAQSGAPTVDVVGYSAGGVVVRWWVGELGGDALARRVVTLASPHHGTDLAALAGDLAPEACPEACQQLAPNSDLLRRLNARDETPPGPLWVSIWTTDDRTVVPASSGSLDGAVDFSVQSVCPALTVPHADVPRTPAVIAMVAAQLGARGPEVPDSEVCPA